MLMWHQCRDKPYAALFISLLMHGLFLLGLMQRSPAAPLQRVTTAMPVTFMAFAPSKPAAAAIPPQLQIASMPNAARKVAPSGQRAPKLSKAMPLQRATRKAVTVKLPITSPMQENKDATNSNSPTVTPLSQSMPQSAEPVIFRDELSLICRHRPSPSYPPTARRLRETGSVVVKVWLNTEGRVERAEIVQSSGFPRLDTLALSAVNTWRCDPPVRGGQPVTAVALQPFHFTLNK